MLSEQVALFGRTDKRQEMPCFESYVATRESYVATRESYVATRESYVACLESQLRHLRVTTTPLAGHNYATCGLRLVEKHVVNFFLCRTTDYVSAPYSDSFLLCFNPSPDI